MTKIIPLNNITKLDLPVDRILETAKGELEGVIIMGYTKDGDEYFASSYADGGTVNWLIDRFKAKLLAVPESEHFE
jgi:hypothetical protein